MFHITEHALLLLVNAQYFENEHPILEMNILLSRHLENEHSREAEYERVHFHQQFGYYRSKTGPNTS